MKKALKPCGTCKYRDTVSCYDPWDPCEYFLPDKKDRSVKNYELYNRMFGLSHSIQEQTLRQLVAAVLYRIEQKTGCSGLIEVFYDEKTNLCERYDEIYEELNRERKT